MADSPPDSTQNGDYRTLLADRRFAPVVLASVVGTLGTNVASPVLPAIAESLMVSDSQIGLVISVYSLSAMIFVPITGVLADLYGRRTVLLPSLLAYGVTGGAIFFVDTFFAILALRVVQGVAYAAIMPLSVTLLGDLYDGAIGSSAQGIRVGANGASSIVVPALAGLLAGVAWYFPFLIYLFALPVMTLAYWYLPETTSNSPNERGIVETLQSYWGAIRSEVTEVDLGVLLFGEFVRDVVRYALITFVPLFAIRVLGASYVQGGAILSIRGVVGMMIGPVSGIFVARSSRKTALIFALLLCALSVAAVPLASNLVTLGLLVGVYAVGDAIFSPVIKDTVTGLASDERRGGVVSGMNTLKYGAQTASPAVFGIVLAASGFTLLFPLASVIAIVYAVLLLVVLRSDI